MIHRLKWRVTKNGGAWKKAPPRLKHLTFVLLLLLLLLFFFFATPRYRRFAASSLADLVE